MNFGNNTRYDPILDPDFDSLFLEDLEQQFDSKSENDYSFKNFTNNELQPQEQQETNQNSNSEKSQSQNNLNSTNNTSNNETDLNSSVEGLIKLGSLRHVPSLESSFSTFNSDPISSIILDQMNNEDDYYENNPIVLKKQRKQPITIPLPEEQTQQKSILYPERKISMEAILKHQNSGNFNPFQPQLDFQMQFQNSNYEMDSSESRSGFVPEFEPDEDDEGDSSYDPNSSKIQIANSNKIEIENNKEKKKKINKQFNFKNKIEKNRKNLKIKKKTKKTTKKEKGTKNNTKNKNKNQNQSKNIKKKVKFKKVEEEFDQKMLKGLSLEDPKLRKRI
ncbi:cnmamide receptor [Anaeramoeba flamelloides]|uniref:Cnmamide receptor n=1 Tax=Anaeramoeba flamelloides TaxID=1746091 RepID=A0AAV7Y492_9EUKA|nr:cnmamide receptor [Anaeramoeba flamelloides]